MKCLGVIAGALCIAGQAHAASLHFAGEPPQIFTIEPRQHLFAHELHLGAGVLPLDAFYVGTTAIASYAYHFDAAYGWEVLNGFYAFNADTALKSTLAAYGVGTDARADDRLRFVISSNFFIKPLSGKMTTFNRALGFVDTRFFVGAGVANYAGTKKDRTSPTINLGIGLHFWASRNMAVRFEVRDHLAIGSQLDNLLLVGLGGSFNFSVRTLDEHLEQL